MDAESLQIEIDRNNLIFSLLIISTLMMLSTFLFSFFVLDNFKRVPCDVNRGLGPPGPAGRQGKASADNTKTGAPGLSPKAGFVIGPRGDAGEELPGDTGMLVTLGTGWPGPVGPTGPKGDPSADGLTEPWLIFTGANQSALLFYSETELIVKAHASTFTNKTADVRVVLIRMGSIVTLNIYPFLMYREAAKVGLQGLITLDLFTKTLPLSEYAPPRRMVLPCIVSKFSVIDTDGSSLVQEATRTNVDWGGAIEIFPATGCTLFGNWSVYDPNTGAPTVSLLFQSDDSPFGLEGVVSFWWLVD
jgi:hypothetical protein